MDTREITHNYRLNKWTEIIRECRSSGQTVSAWCAANNINVKSYYYWLKRVCTAACDALPPSQSGGSSIVPVNMSALSVSTTSADNNQNSGITMRFGNITLELHNDASTALIENTVRALQNVM